VLRDESGVFSLIRSIFLINEVRAVKTSPNASSTMCVVAGARMGAPTDVIVVATVFKH
jgi:hypothetical protein